MIILAPTAAGKSTLVNQIGGRLVDGDVIIRDTIGWPANPTWWQSDPMSPGRIAFRNEKARVLAAYETEHPDDVVLFNGHPETMAAIIPKGRLMAWIPSEAALKANAIRRAAAGNHSQPTDLRTILNNARSIRETVLRHLLPLITREQIILAAKGQASADSRDIKRWWRDLQTSLPIATKP
jgi:hypothetical protein